ncbi:MAG TPA: hypothetical protein VHK47_16900 [Polyangia bacterium]|jgi:hypothetical protein|nr:hypothetical protein [Polyangia bacterium]
MPIGRTTIAALLLSFVGAAAGCRTNAEKTREAFTRGMEAYLAKRGDLCVGRPSWPIDVADEDAASRGPDAVQLPILERLGVVTSTALPARVGGAATPFGMRRYRLTVEGRKHYLERATRTPLPPDAPDAASRADLCVARLGLARVERWELHAGATPTAVVSYTYTVEAPPWTSDAAFQRAFPAVARVLRGASTAQLVERFTQTPEGWVADELLPSRMARGAQASAP